MQTSCGRRNRLWFICTVDYFSAKRINYCYNSLGESPENCGTGKKLSPQGCVRHDWFMQHSWKDPSAGGGRVGLAVKVPRGLVVLGPSVPGLLGGRVL